MLKREYLACLEIHKRLKEKVIGSVYVTIENDTLIVHIYGFRGIKFNYEFKCLSYEIVDDTLDYEKIIRIIMTNYKEYILSKFVRRWTNENLGIC